ncbi:MAG: P27 family phage terminase small subunit [Nocardioidaceae bacterium]
MSPDPRKPRAPAGLSRRSGSFWRATVSAYDLSTSEVELLAEVCRCIDEIDLLQVALDAQGVTVTGSSGQPRVNPAVGEVRQHRLALARLVRQLALPTDVAAKSTPNSQRASDAAKVRWSLERARKASRGGQA